MRGFYTGLFAAYLFCLPAIMLGQAEPATSVSSVSNAMPSSNFGFNLPSKLGTLSYSLSGSEQIENGFGASGVYAGTTFSGNLAYLSKSENNPFSLVYSGGLTFGNIPGNVNRAVLPECGRLTGLSHAFLGLCSVRLVQLSTRLAHDRTLWCRRRR